MHEHIYSLFLTHTTPHTQPHKEEKHKKQSAPLPKAFGYEEPIRAYDLHRYPSFGSIGKAVEHLVGVVALAAAQHCDQMSAVPDVVAVGTSHVMHVRVMCHT